MLLEAQLPDITVRRGWKEEVSGINILFYVAFAPQIKQPDRHLGGRGLGFDPAKGEAIPLYFRASLSLMLLAVSSQGENHLCAEDPAVWAQPTSHLRPILRM